MISGAKLEESLDEYGISIGQVVYVEYATNSNQWPTDNIASKSLNTSGVSPGEDPRSLRKTNGLYNLGNSKIFLIIDIACYMNSALQCLANTKFFSEYFIKEKRYMK